MSTSGALEPSPPVYGLSFQCPIPFLAHPSYPVLSPATATPPDLALPAAYTTALYNLSPTSLSAFAHLLLSFREAPSSPHDLLRAFLLPIHDLDHKYRQLVPVALGSIDAPEDSNDTLNANVPQLDEDAKAALLEAHRRWTAERAAAATTAVDSSATGVGGRKAGAESSGKEMAKPLSWTTDSGTLEEWLTDLELVDTLLQCLLLLTLLTLTPPPLPKEKAKKKRDPERHAATLDPALLLDFLTDRLAIWRVMRDFSSLNSSTEKKDEAERPTDTVSTWWRDIVEPLFAPLLPPDILPPHKLKLFPTPEQSTSDPLLRAAPAPSPFRRSLLSLDRSARRKHRLATEGTAAESPTMKRLGLGSGMMGGMVREKEDFKVPLVPAGRRKAGRSDSGRLKLLGRQEVSLTRKPLQSQAAKKRKGDSPRRVQPATSFAALGAAFRQGAAVLDAPSLPPPLPQGLTPVKRKAPGWVVPPTPEGG